MLNITREQYMRDITYIVIEALKNGTAPWQRGWSCDCTPVNAVSKKYFRGINSIIMAIEARKLSRNGDLRWATKKQAESKGWTIKAGAKPLEITMVIVKEANEYAGMFSDRIIILNQEEAKTTPIIRKVKYFHASQINGIPELKFAKNEFTHERIISNDVIDRIIYNSSARIFEGGIEASYSPRRDLITMPVKRSFADTESYYSTLLHELVHWTGHESRLDRVVSWNNRDKKSYAREELIAELASMYLSAETGLPQTQEHFDNHAAYIDSWISLLKSDHNEIFNAEREARKAVKFIMAFKNEFPRTKAAS